MYCPKCGNSILQGEKFCNKCGNAIVQSEEKASCKKKLWLVSSLAVVVLAIVVILCVFVFRKEPYEKLAIEFTEAVLLKDGDKIEECFPKNAKSGRFLFHDELEDFDSCDVEIVKCVARDEAKLKYLQKWVEENEHGDKVTEAYDIRVEFQVDDDDEKYPAEVTVVKIDGEWYVRDFELDINDTSEKFFDKYLDE